MHAAVGAGTTWALAWRAGRGTLGASALEAWWRHYIYYIYYIAMSHLFRVGGCSQYNVPVLHT